MLVKVPLDEFRSRTTKPRDVSSIRTCRRDTVPSLSESSGCSFNSQIHSVYITSKQAKTNNPQGLLAGCGPSQVSSASRARLRLSGLYPIHQDFGTADVGRSGALPRSPIRSRASVFHRLQCPPNTVPAPLDRLDRRNVHQIKAAESLR